MIGKPSAGNSVKSSLSWSKSLMFLRSQEGERSTQECVRH
jgi:hypothetical protein